MNWQDTETPASLSWNIKLSCHVSVCDQNIDELHADKQAAAMLQLNRGKGCLQGENDTVAVYADSCQMWSAES